MNHEDRNEVRTAAKVEQRHRDEADRMFYWCLEMDGPQECERIAQALASAETAGYAAGVKDEREACAAWHDEQAAHFARFADEDATRRHRKYAAAIRARSDAKEVKP